MKALVAPITLAALVLFSSVSTGAPVSVESRFFLKDGELVSYAFPTAVWTLNFSCRLERSELTVDGDLTEAKLWIESTLQLHSDGIKKIDIELYFLDANGKVLENIDYREVEDFNAQTLRHEQTLIVPPETDSIAFTSSTRGGRLGGIDGGGLPPLREVFRKRLGD